MGQFWCQSSSSKIDKTAAREVTGKTTRPLPLKPLSLGNTAAHRTSLHTYRGCCSLIDLCQGQRAGAATFPHVPRTGLLRITHKSGSTSSHTACAPPATHLSLPSAPLFCSYGFVPFQSTCTLNSVSFGPAFKCHGHELCRRGTPVTHGNVVTPTDHRTDNHTQACSDLKSSCPLVLQNKLQW